SWLPAPTILPSASPSRSSKVVISLCFLACQTLAGRAHGGLVGPSWRPAAGAPRPGRAPPASPARSRPTRASGARAPGPFRAPAQWARAQGLQPCVARQIDRPRVRGRMLADGQATFFQAFRDEVVFEQSFTHGREIFEHAGRPERIGL